MSIRLMSTVWDIQFPTQSQLLVALKLADFANDAGGSIYPSRNTLARNVQCSESTIKNVLRLFREIGLLIVVREGGHGPKSTTEYALNLRLIDALSNGRCELVGGSDEMAIEWVDKGAEFDPLEGAEFDLLDAVRGQPGALRGQSTPAKGSAGYPQSTNNHHLEPPARADARATQDAARPPRAMPRITLTPADASWSAWLDRIETDRGADARRTVEDARRVEVAARWPRDDVPAPQVHVVRDPTGEAA